MASALFYIRDTFLSFGGTPLLEGASLTVDPRDRIALVGRNGSGKSTLMKIASGLVEADQCDTYEEPGLKVAYLPQEPDFSGFSTAVDYVVNALDDTSNSHIALRLLEDLNVAPDLATSSMSGGESRRTAIAAILASNPDIFLLDEPTNHLDLPAIEWLEEKFRASPAALVLISHDRRFLENLTTRTVWIDRGKTKDLNRGFAHFEAWRDKLLEEEELEHHKLARKIVREEHWVRYGVTARRKRNVRRMKELQELRSRHRNARSPQGKVNFASNESEKSAKKVIETKGIAKSFGDQVIVSDFSIKITRGSRIGIVAPNGAGKTTLISMLTGLLPPDAGEIEIGANVEMVSLDQRRASLEPTMRVADAITDGRGDFVEIDGSKKHASTYLQDFLFSAEQWRAPVSTLSGGEKGRLALAAALAKQSNLLVLDEPTNDLDLETLDLLEEMLAGYGGTLILVSHDRSFLDRIVTSIIAQDGNGKKGAWREYVGGYDDMVRQRDAALPPSDDPAISKAQKTTTPAPPAKPSGKSKLSFKEKYALENLPKEMETLSASINDTKKSLADPSLFEKDPAKFNRLAKALTESETRLEEAEEEWLALELKREEMEAN